MDEFVFEGVLNKEPISVIFHKGSSKWKIQTTLICGKPDDVSGEAIVIYANNLHDVYDVVGDYIVRDLWLDESGQQHVSPIGYKFKENLIKSSKGQFLKQAIAAYESAKAQNHVCNCSISGKKI